MKITVVGKKIEQTTEQDVEMTEGKAGEAAEEEKKEEEDIKT